MCFSRCETALGLVVINDRRATDGLTFLTLLPRNNRALSITPIVLVLPKPATPNHVWTVTEERLPPGFTPADFATIDLLMASLERMPLQELLLFFATYLEVNKKRQTSTIPTVVSAPIEMVKFPEQNKKLQQLAA